MLPQVLLGSTAITEEQADAAYDTLEQNSVVTSAGFMQRFT
jgi:hypothetical protein